MIAADELAAVIAALQMLASPEAASEPERPSRWKSAARRPDLELEDLRAI